MSASVAPMLLIRRKPRTAKVEGKRRASNSHTQGMLLWGHEMPVRKSKGTEVITTQSITCSRWRTAKDKAIAAKMEASK